MPSSKSNLTYETILACVVDIIETKGEAGIRISQIARETGTSISSIYHFYGDREGLIAAAQAHRYIESLEAQLVLMKMYFTETSTLDEARDAVRVIVESVTSPERAQVRLTRLNVVGSTLGRPLLAEKVAAAQDRYLVEFGALLKLNQDRRWIRPDIDCVALAAFIVGTVMGRVLIELGPSSVDPDEWNHLFMMSMTFAITGEELPAKG
jgi:AcrR family transcriptional regulator